MSYLIIVSALESVTTEQTFGGGIERAAYLNAEVLSQDYEIFFITNYWAKKFSSSNVQIISTAKQELFQTVAKLPQSQAVICHCPSISIRNTLLKANRGPLLIYEHNRPGTWCSVATVRKLHSFPNWFTNTYVWNPIWIKIQKHCTPNKPLRTPKVLPVAYYDPQPIVNQGGNFLLSVGREERQQGINKLAKLGIPIHLYLPAKPENVYDSPIKVHVAAPFDEIMFARSQALLNVSLYRLESFGLGVFESSQVGLQSVGLIGRNFGNPYENHSPFAKVVNRFSDLMEYVKNYAYDPNLAEKIRTSPLLANFSLQSYKQSWLNALLCLES